MQLDRDIEDYGTVVNALLDGPNVPATIAFSVNWVGTQKYSASDSSFAFRGLKALATMQWSAREQGFEFQSDPPNTSTTLFAAIGEERNGRFR